MFDLGLALRPADFRLVMRRPIPDCAGLIGQIILLPLIAWVVYKGFGLTPVFYLGTMLVACSPGGSSSNVFSMLAGGDVALSVTLTACSSLVTLITVPIVMALATSATGSDMEISLPIGNLLIQNILLMAFPIAFGLWLSMRKKSLASKIHSVLRRMAFPLLVFLASVFFLQHRETIVREFPVLGMSMTALIITAMACGALISFLLRLHCRERKTIIIEVGMQNAAQAITVACSPVVFNNEEMAIPAIIYALMMNILLLAYVAVVKK